MKYKKKALQWCMAKVNKHDLLHQLVRVQSYSAFSMLQYSVKSRVGVLLLKSCMLCYRKKATHIHAYTHKYTCVHMSMDTQTRMHTHTHTHARTHTQRTDLYNPQAHRVPLGPEPKPQCFSSGSAGQDSQRLHWRTGTWASWSLPLLLQSALLSLYSKTCQLALGKSTKGINDSQQEFSFSSALWPVRTKKNAMKIKNKSAQFNDRKGRYLNIPWEQWLCNACNKVEN